MLDDYPHIKEAVATNIQKPAVYVPLGVGAFFFVFGSLGTGIVMGGLSYAGYLAYNKFLT